MKKYSEGGFGGKKGSKKSQTKGTIDGGTQKYMNNEREKGKTNGRKGEKKRQRE